MSVNTQCASCGFPIGTGHACANGNGGGIVYVVGDPFDAETNARRRQANARRIVERAMLGTGDRASAMYPVMDMAAALRQSSHSSERVFEHECEDVLVRFSRGATDETRAELVLINQRRLPSQLRWLISLPISAANATAGSARVCNLPMRNMGLRIVVRDDRMPPVWLLDGKPVPGWTMTKDDNGKRTDLCKTCRPDKRKAKR